MMSMCLTWTLTIAVAQAAGGPATPTTRAAELEILPSKHVAVRATVNGKGPFRLLFDTGAPLLILTPDAARRAGVIEEGDGAAAGPLGLGRHVLIERVEIGGARVESLSGAVTNHDALRNLSAVCGELDGIVGFSFFARFDTVIDYQAARVTFTANGYAPRDVLKSVAPSLGGMGGGKRVVPRPVVLGVTLEAKEPVVRAVAPGGAAEAAGLKAGDRILSFDGRWIEDARDVSTAASTLVPNEATSVRIARPGEAEPRTLTLYPRKGL
jgi:hypothetical protein